MYVMVNGGAEPVATSSGRCARSNMRHFVAELRLDGVTVDRKKSWDTSGRYGFKLRRKGRSVDILMPGCAFARVRYTGEQPVFGFYRLYIEGSSFLWMFAKGLAIEALDPKRARH